MAIVGKILLTSKGEYISSNSYEILDVVRYNRASWICKKHSVGNEPKENSEFWQVLAKDSDEVEVMQGATSVSDGKAGLVPKPTIADRKKFLKGDGTFADVDMDSKVDGKGIKLYIQEGRPHLTYQITDENIEDIVENIFDGDTSNDIGQDDETQIALNNIFDDDESNDAPQDNEVDKIINEIYRQETVDI